MTLIFLDFQSVPPELPVTRAKSHAMIAPKCDCSRARLQQLLADQLTETVATDVTQHIEGCETCRRDLEMLAAEASWWQDAQRFLADDESDQPEHPVHDGARSWPHQTRDEAFVSPDLIVEYLEPADDPRILGRLDQYEVLEVVGCGGMGIVLKGHDRQLNRHVAIKVLAPHYATSAAARQRFAREAQAAAAVVHQHVLAIHGVSEGGKLPYLVMPFVAGQSLQERISEHGTLDVKDVLRIGMQAAEGLAAAHAQGLVHRDVKPANILLENGVERVLLTDFGLARAIDDASLTRSGIIAGTPQYMSPEQARGDAVDHRTDLFSLGSVLYAMCAGRPPFRAETTMGVLRRISDVPPRPLQDVNPDVPAWLASIIERLLAKSPDDRFQSASEVAALLERCLAHLQHPAAVPLPDAARARSRRTRRLKPWHIVATVSVVGIVVTAVVLAVSGWFGPSGPIGKPLEGRPPAIAPVSTDGSEDVTEAAVLPAEKPADDEILWQDGIEEELYQIEADLQWLEYTSEL
jgi:serine/threonine-protein kinase